MLHVGSGKVTSASKTWHTLWPKFATALRYVALRWRMRRPNHDNAPDMKRHANTQAKQDTHSLQHVQAMQGSPVSTDGPVPNTNTIQRHGTRTTLIEA
jgi:hypothetical protein